MRAHAELLGFGLAGAAFACAHFKRARPAELLIVDPASTLKQQRSLSFFETGEHLFSRCVSHRWRQARVISAAGQTQQIALPWPYARMCASDVYDFAREQLPRSVEWLAAAPEDLSPALQLDSRPILFKPLLLQHFEGFDVSADRDCFDPDCVTLMDFSVSQSTDAIHFCYVLPWDRRHALVEDTYISAPEWPRPDYRGECEQWLATRFPNARFALRLSESGRLPMDSYPPLGGGSGVSVDIGARGGFLRASTGYSTADTLRAAQLYANSSALSEPALLRAQLKKLRPRLSTWMDRVFLRALCATPAQGPALFTTLFKRAAAQRLIPFLNGTAGFFDHLAVIRALPPMPLLRSL